MEPFIVVFADLIIWIEYEGSEGLSVHETEGILDIAQDVWN